jgi:hypothetical protein
MFRNGKTKILKAFRPETFRETLRQKTISLKVL